MTEQSTTKGSNWPTVPPKSGWFSVILWMPCPLRFEGCSVGVCLLQPSRNIDIKMTDDYSRVNRFFPDSEVDFSTCFEAFADRFCAEHIETVEQLAHFIDTRANQIHMTAPRWTRVDDDFGAELDRLFQDCVL